MKSISVEDQDQQFLIRIDKGTVDKETLVELLHNIRVEELSKQANFSEEIEELGEEIKEDWWSKNKGRWIEDV